MHEKESEKKTNLGRTQAKKEKKTKLEKSMESLQRDFREVAEMETESFLKLEDLRHKREMEYELKMKELDNERRREERKHEQFFNSLLKLDNHIKNRNGNTDSLLAYRMQLLTKMQLVFIM